jgi:hypothetical protein
MLNTHDIFTPQNIKIDTVKNDFKKTLQKLNFMAALKIKQLQYETDTWKRLIGFIVDENVCLKNRLSEILKNGFSRNLLAEIENFQNGFVEVDHRFGLLRHDVNEIDELLRKEEFEDGKMPDQVNKKLITLRANLIHADKQFDNLKMEFNSYMLKNT